MDDLSLSTTDYNSVVSILFVGYIGFQVPSNMIIGKISRPALYICLACAAWGVVSALTAAVHNYVGLMMARVALGITEAVFVGLIVLPPFFSSPSEKFTLQMLTSQDSSFFF
jgi:predicted MFS family arabinose efflux permease